jgi:hypothetical protein
MASSNTTNDELPSLMCAIGSESTSIDDELLGNEIVKFLDQLGPKEDVFLLPPDFTRFHSQAGKITAMIAKYYRQTEVGGGEAAVASSPTKLQIMPALGKQRSG